MDKFVSRFFEVLILVYALNSLYIFLFTSSDGEFRLVGLIEISKLGAGYSYLGLALLWFIVMKYEDRKSKV
jgi:hypothetical protein